MTRAKRLLSRLKADKILKPRHADARSLLASLTARRRAKVTIMSGNKQWSIGDLY